MMKKVGEYHFRAVHKRTEGTVCRSFEYTKAFRVMLVDAYNHTTTYKIEIIDVQLSFDQKYKKMEDFYRRLQWIYNGITVAVNNNGRVVSVVNTDELRRNWAKRKQYILRDYNGSSVANYVNRVTANFDDESFFLDLFGRYKEFGLLFGHIPPQHAEQYTGKRIMTVHNNENLSVLENITFDKQEDGICHYNLSAQTMPDSKLHAHFCEGSLWRATDSPLIKKATLNISYGNKWNNEWTFCLCRI